MLPVHNIGLGLWHCAELEIAVHVLLPRPK